MHSSTLKLFGGYQKNALLGCSFSLVIGQSGFSQNASIVTGASPELVNQLTQQLSITPAQATGGAGASFGWPRAALVLRIFSKVAAVGSFLKGAPATDSTSGLSGFAGSLPGNLGVWLQQQETFRG